MVQKMFTEGQKVHCVDSIGAANLVNGKMYVIDEVYEIEPSVSIGGVSYYSYRFEAVKEGNEPKVVPFQKGDRVVCIDTKRISPAIQPQLELGKIYEIERIDNAGENRVYVQGTLYYAKRFRHVIPGIDEPGLIDIKSLKKGDVVTLHLEYVVTEGPQSDGTVPITGKKVTPVHYFLEHDRYIGTVKRAPENNWKVHDRVVDNAGYAGEIIGVHGDTFWFLIDGEVNGTNRKAEDFLGKIG